MNLRRTWRRKTDSAGVEDGGYGVVFPCRRSRRLISTSNGVYKAGTYFSKKYKAGTYAIFGWPSESCVILLRGNEINKVLL